MEFCDIEIEGMRIAVTENEIKTYKPEGNGLASNSQSHKPEGNACLPARQGLASDSQSYKYPDDFINKIICGDCLELIKSIPDKKIDCVITDPPYGLNKNGIKNDKDLSFFYNVLPDCYRVLKDDSYFKLFGISSG